MASVALSKQREHVRFGEHLRLKMIVDGQAAAINAPYTTMVVRIARILSFSYRLE